MKQISTGFEPTDIFAALNVARVKYLVFGGVAVVLYGVGRLTWDVDLIVHLTTENVERLTNALKRLGFRPRVPADPKGLADSKMRRKWIKEKGMKVYSFIEDHAPSRNVDVMVEPPRNFSALYRQRKIVKVKGISVPLVPVKTLARLKRAAGRPQDLQDIADLHLIGLI